MPCLAECAGSLVAVMESHFADMTYNACSGEQTDALAVVQYAIHDPEASLAQNSGNASPAAASDDAFAVLEAASSAALEAASFAAWLDVTQAAAPTVPSVSSAAAQTEHPEMAAAE